MRYLVKLMCRFFVAPAVVGEVQVSRGRAIFGEVEASIVVGGAVFGALFRGIWNDGQREMLYFRKKTLAAKNCTCHEKSESNITKYCACHQKNCYN